MDGPTFYERLRILLHDKGEGFITPNPFWKDSEIERRAIAAREVLYTTLIDKSRVTGEPLVCLNNLIADVPATEGTSVPADFYQIIMGYAQNPYRYVNPSGIPLGAALPGFDAVWSAGGVFHGTAARAVYYRSPTGDLSANATTFTDFSDGFYDAVITLTAVEIIMGETQDAADRLDDLNELFLDQMKTLV